MLGKNDVKRPELTQRELGLQQQMESGEKS